MPQPPIVKSLSKDPEFIRLRGIVNAAPTLAGRLAAVDVAKGYYSPGFALTLDQRRRGTLALMVLQDALGQAPAEWGDAGHDARPPGEVAAQVLHAALLGAADAGLVPGLAELAPAAIAAALVPAGLPVYVALKMAQRGLAGATIADAVKTDLALPTALQLLRNLDPAAAELVAQGAAAAGAQHSAAYGDALKSRFTRDFATFANPFSNPIWGNYAKGAAVFAGAVVLYRVTRKQR